jgi:hypothetical protein
MIEAAVKTTIRAPRPNFWRSIFRLCCYTSITLVLAGCTPDLIRVDLSKYDAPPPGEATVFIIRPPYLSYGSRDLLIKVNNTEIASLPRMSYTSFLMPPGQLTLSGEGSFFSWPRREITIDIKDGQHYYLSWHVKESASSALMLYLFPTMNELRWESISKEHAQTLLDSVYYVEPTFPEVPR